MISNQSKLSANENILKKRRKKIDQLIITKKELKVNVEYEEEKSIREVENLALKVNSLKELIEALEKSAASIMPRIKPKEIGPTPKLRTDNSVSNNSGAEFLLLKGKLDKPSKWKPYIKIWRRIIKV